MEQGDTGVDHWKNNRKKLRFILIIWMLGTLLLRNFYTFSMYSFITAEPKLTGLPGCFQELISNSSFTLMTTKPIKSILEIEVNRKYENKIILKNVLAKQNISHELVKKLRVFASSNHQINDLLSSLLHKKPLFVQNATGYYKYEDIRQFGFVFQEQNSELQTLISIFSGKRMVDNNRNDVIHPGIMAWDSYTKNELLFKFFKKFLKRFAEFGLYDYLKRNSSLSQIVESTKIINNDWFKRNWDFVALKQYFIGQNSDMFIGDLSRDDISSFQLYSWLLIWYILLVLHVSAFSLFVVELCYVFEMQLFIMRVRNYRTWLRLRYYK
jgi:hypothetical protein